MLVNYEKMRFHNDDEYFEYCSIMSEIREEEARNRTIKLTKREMIDMKLWDYFCELRFGKQIDDDEYWSNDLFELSYHEAIELNLID